MRFLTGVQPSGHLHIGNYFGAMRAAINLQDEGETVYFIADYHALTTVHKAEELRSYVREVALGWLACGLDPEKATFFRQSAVPEVHELAWLLSCVTPMGLLERCVSYKDKVGQGFTPNHGLFAYPALMAADILLYGADVVPVGKDQKQHLEVARDMAAKFNDACGEAVLKLPEPRIQEDVATITGLDGRKMSKSYNNTLDLFGDEKVLAKRIMSIPTDSTPVEAPKPTEGSTLVDLHKLVSTPEQHAEYLADMQRGGIGYGEFKKRLAARVQEYFAPMRERYAYFASRPDDVDDILQTGASRARELAEPTLNAALYAVGLV
ncbi:MAG: tryptophan--tRNA ligase [Candidatus Methylacidiphilales bacterium]|nr:tryptophan--tRNA ligase [Candidatus Methylacidiphilales bacterium]